MLLLFATGYREMKNHKIVEIRSFQNQSGAVLLVSLIFLLLLTVIGLSAIQSSTLQERMAGNTRDINAAFQAAEAGIREAEEFLQSATLPAFDGTDGLYQVCFDTDSTSSVCTVPEWGDAESTGWVELSDINDVSKQPEFYIQKYISVYDPQGDLASDVPPKIIDIYKIVSRGFGVSDSSLVALETTYRRD